MFLFRSVWTIHKDDGSVKHIQWEFLENYVFLSSLDKQGDVPWRYPFKLSDKSLQKAQGVFS